MTRRVDSGPTVDEFINFSNYTVVIDTFVLELVLKFPENVKPDDVIVCVSSCVCTRASDFKVTTAIIIVSYLSWPAVGDVVGWEARKKFAERCVDLRDLACRVV